MTELAQAMSRPHQGTDHTPRLELDVSAAIARLRALTRVLPQAQVRYAVKANPDPTLLRALVEAGAGFDVASPAEAEAALGSGARPDMVLHSNPVSRRDHLRTCAAMGVRQYVVDSLQEVAKVADEAPGSMILVRILTSGAGADWPLSRKFGCSPDHAVALLAAAADLGLVVGGVAFHVGSQQRDPRAWCPPILAAAEVFGRVRALGLEPTHLDLGGGFPARHEGPLPPLSDYGLHIGRALRESFGSRQPLVLLEPGRGIVGDAGTLVARVIAVVDRGERRWVHLDAGVFTGLVETLDEAIRYRIDTDRGGPTGPCVLAGPTCDSADVLYEHVPVDLPLELDEGDEVRFRSAGAYTSCYSTVGFNGFAPLPTVLVG